MQAPSQPVLRLFQGFCNEYLKGRFPQQLRWGCRQPGADVLCSVEDQGSAGARDRGTVTVSPGGEAVPGDTTAVVTCLNLQVLLQIELCVCHPWAWFLQSRPIWSWAVLSLFLTLSLCPQISYLPFTEAFERAQAEKKLVHSILLWGALDDQSC